MKKWWEYAEQTPIYAQVYNEMMIKRKWFKRNLRDFALKHNKLLNDMQNNKGNGERLILKEKTVEKFPDDFHYKTYNIVCKILKPFYGLRKLIKK